MQFVCEERQKSRTVAHHEVAVKGDEAIRQKTI